MYLLELDLIKMNFERRIWSDLSTFPLQIIKTYIFVQLLMNGTQIPKLQGSDSQLRTLFLLSKQMFSTATLCRLKQNPMLIGKHKHNPDESVPLRQQQIRLSVEYAPFDIHYSREKKSFMLKGEYKECVQNRLASAGLQTRC